MVEAVEQQISVCVIQALAEDRGALVIAQDREMILRARACADLLQREVRSVPLDQESGDLDSAKIGTIRRYLEAAGGGLAVEFVMGDERVQVA